MPRKERTFATKVAKMRDKTRRQCPKCDGVMTVVQLVTSERSAVTGAWRFNQRFVSVCKCNEKEILG
jgi:hypothetical protein